MGRRWGEEGKGIVEGLDLIDPFAHKKQRWNCENEASVLPGARDKFMMKLTFFLSFFLLFIYFCILSEIWLVSKDRKTRKSLPFLRVFASLLRPESIQQEKLQNPRLP